MRITLTGRRLTLAAVLVLAGVAAPLAWATVAGKGGSTPSTAAAVSPAPLRMAPRGSAPLPSASVSPDAATATADNPYQVSRVVTLTPNQYDCFFPILTPGVNFVLDQATVFPDYTFGGVTLQNAWLRLFVKMGSSFPTDALTTEPLLTVEAGGRYAVRNDGLHWVVKPSPFASAAVGDIYEIYVCAQNGPTAGRVVFTLTGQKLTGAPTASSVSDFNARSRAQGALLRWTTASEAEILGFNIWRYRGVKGVKVNRTLIRAKRSGEPAGASYRYIDYVRGAKRGLTYRLQLVDLKGKRTWYAAFAIASK